MPTSSTSEQASPAVQVDPAPKQSVSAQPAQAAQAGAGTQWLTQYLQQCARPDPTAVAVKLQQFPSEQAAMMQLLQQTAGNGFVQQVMSAQRGGAHSSPMQVQLDADKPPAPMADGTVIDGGALGTVVTNSATALAEVDLGTVNAQLTSIANGPQLTINAAVPLSAIHAESITPAQIQQITNVTKLGGIGGTLGYQLNAGVLQLTLSGVSKVQALEMTTFKLWLACGETVALRVKASTFHTEVSEMDRTEARSEIANEETALNSERGARVGFVAGEEARGKTADTSGYDQTIRSTQGWLERDQAQLGDAQKPRFVDLDSNGAPIK